MKTLLLDKNNKMVRLIEYQSAIKKIAKGVYKALKYNQNNIPLIVIDNNFDRQKVQNQVKNCTSNRRLSKQILLQRDDYKCQYCEEQLNQITMTKDHVNPKANGGKITPTNVVCACWECNQKKAGRTPEQAGMKLIKQVQPPKMFYQTKQMLEIYNNYMPLELR